MAISGKYEHKSDFLKGTLEIFTQNKMKFSESYDNFLKVTQANIENYARLDQVINFYSEY